MILKLEKKFTEKHIDNFVNLIYKNFIKNPNDNYIFDLSETEWISNQNLLLITALLKYFYQSKVSFKVLFKKPGIPSNEISDRTKLQIVQLWEIWEIYSVIDEQDYSSYFDISSSIIKEFKIDLINKRKYNEKEKEIYNRLGITPFIAFNKIDDYKDNELLNFEINPIYDLNEVVLEKLSSNNCMHPFVNNTLSTIITKELYENFLDHFQNTIFPTNKNWAFMSLALKQRLNNPSPKILSGNFFDEEIKETESFFKKNNEFINESLIQFSFLDFGDGIVTTLLNQYKQDIGIVESDLFDTIDPNEVLKYAFKHNTSRNPIKNDNENDLFIPRGLFDLITIVKRYNGLLIVRSNYGKIIYNFSETQDFENAFSKFGNSTHFFPGTFITIYLPALLNEEKFDKSAIKPNYKFDVEKIEKTKYINIFTLLKKLPTNKDDLYNSLIDLLKESIEVNDNHKVLNYISFLGCDDERIIKKIIFFLLTDYNINIKNNVIILHPPDLELINNVNDELLNLNSVIKDFKIHPVPFIYLDKVKNEIDIEWAGLFNEEDKRKLNEYIFEGVIFPKTDFNELHNIFGNLHFSDRQGNVLSSMPKTHTLTEYYNTYSKIDDILIEDLVQENNCIKEDGLYLCNGNYYQNKFLQLNELLSNDEVCDKITKLLFDKINKTHFENKDINYVAITSSSHKILSSLIKQGLIDEEKCLFLDNYIYFDTDLIITKIKSKKTYILVCDAISNGSLTRRIERLIIRKNSSLIGVAVIANTVDESFENTKKLISEFDSRIIHLYKFPIKKYRRQNISNKELLKNVVRINPHTNIPITFSENSTLKETILLNNSEFIDYIDDENIDINLKVFNNRIHPYFFNLHNIFEKENINISTNQISILDEIFKKLNQEIEINNKLKIFYPKKSDIKKLDFDLFKSKILTNQSIGIFELERYISDDGWKFPHTTDFYSKIVENNNVLIFDDGSCSGDSLLQMINELSYFKPNKIDLLCLVGRVNNHKREFFSKISSLKININENSDLNKIKYQEIKIRVYFGSQWNISTFHLENSPFTQEINWLKELLKIQNAPLSIKSIAKSILDEITPKDKNTEDYKFFPKQKITGEIPKKDLIIVRNEIGKIIGYRFYKESFEWFNDFITKYEKKERAIDRTKEIELLCMCILYEPYLYEKISNLLPDIREKVEEFIDNIILGNPNNDYKKINIEEYLYYDWSKNKRDIIHLFFIIYSGENLINKLTNKNFIDLLEFSKDTFKKTNSINYIFYKFLRFFPLEKSEISSKNNIIKLKEFFYEIIKNETIDPKSLAEIKRFYSFINTLPNNEDINSQIDKIKNLYWRHKQPQLHDNRESFNHNISRIITNLSELKDQCNDGEELDKLKVIKVKESWWNLKHTFLDNIISFYRTFEDFFKPYPYRIILSKLENKNNSLIEMYTFLDDFIFNLSQKGTDEKNYKKSLEFIEIIQNSFGLDSEFKNIFEKPNMLFSEFENKLKTNFELLENKIIFNKIEIEDFYINIPASYVEKLIIEELKSNISSYSDKTKEIKINFKKTLNPNAITENINVEIINIYSDIVKEFSSSEGLNCLNLMSNSELFNFGYNNSVIKENKTFVQNLIFYP